jgi:uncharacterized LabA/DUF88 family protein
MLHNTPHPTPTGRTLHLVDLENLAARRHVTPAIAGAIAEQYRDVAGHRTGDLTVVGSSHHNGFAALVAFPGSTVRWRSGRDGADLAIIAAFDEFDLERFDRVVIGSGDGIFAELADRCHNLGLAVTVVAGPTALSQRLAAATEVVAHLDVATGPAVDVRCGEAA